MFLDFSLISGKNMYRNYILCNHSNHDSIIQDILIFIHSMCGYFVKEIYSSVEVLRRIKGVGMSKDFLMCPKISHSHIGPKQNKRKRHRNPYLHADNTNDYVSPHKKK